MELSIRGDGTVVGIYGEDLNLAALDLGPMSTRRASHVEPAEDGTWTADMSPVGGPLLDGFELRSEALAAEVAWLADNLGRIEP